MKRNKRRIEYTLKKSLSIIISVIIIASSLNLPGFNGLFKGIALDTHAKAPTNKTKTVGSLKEFYEFARDYSSGDQRTHVVLAFPDAIEISSSKDFGGETIAWKPLGTETCPFGGRITISAEAGMTKNILANEPIFGYVMDSVEITNINDILKENPGIQPINLVRTISVAEGETKPLFANCVVHDGATDATPATWDIGVDGSGTYSGIIGTVGNGADNTEVKINLTLYSSAAVEGAENVGLICGTIQKDSHVSVIFSQGPTANNQNNNLGESDPLELIEEENEEDPEENPEEESEEQSEEYSEEQPEEQSEEQSEEQTEEPSEEQTEEQSEEQTEEQTEEQSEVQPEEKPDEQSGEEFNEGTNEETLGILNETVSNLIGENDVEVIGEEVLGEPGEENIEEINEENTEETNEENTEENNEENTEENNEETSEAISEETSEETSEITSEETSEETSEITSEETSEKSSEKDPKDADEEDGDKRATVSNIRSITSSSLCAGGFVGQMFENATLLIVTNGLYDVSSSSRTITGGTYAGGLVGYNDRGTVEIKASAESAELKYNAQGTISAGTAAGGIFGYYKVDENHNKFSPVYYTSTNNGCTLSASIAGALVGELNGNGLDIVYSGTSSERLAVQSSLATGSVTNATFGGLVGNYENTGLEKSFVIEYVDVTIGGVGATTYGGAIARLAGSTPAYVKINEFTVSSSGASDCTYFGGAVGSAGDAGSMVDVGNITVTTSGEFAGGGVLGRLTKGVLRLSGVTNLTAATSKAAVKEKRQGQIVGERLDGLVYALGSGADEATSSYGNGWRLVRSTTDAAADDIGTWGEVVRITDAETDSVNPDADAIFVYDSTNHTVTVASPVYNMTSAGDFAKTALNLQLNDGANAGALRFAQTAKSRTKLLKENYSISGTIDLRGTGITGFMRDGCLSDAANEVKFFTGKLSKAEPEEGEDPGATIILAVGERYGIYTGTANGRGAIHAHGYCGLFARVGDGAEVSDITLDGTMDIVGCIEMYIGGVAAYLHNTVTFTNVNAIETINYKHSGGKQYVGGLIGLTGCDAGKTLTIQGTDESSKALIAPEIIITGATVNNAEAVCDQAIGGLIGYINSKAAATFDISNITLSANVDASGAGAAGNISVAGLISDIVWNETDTRTLNLSNIDVADTSVKHKASVTGGGILGYRWFGTNVSFENVKLTAGESDNELCTSASNVGGLVYCATGHWQVPSENGIEIDSIAITKAADTVATPSSLGIIVHSGYYSNNGLYLELRNENSYILNDGLSYIPDMSGKTYDELVACLSGSAADLLKNNKSGIITYKTDGDYNMDNDRNSYNNVYNITVVNNRSRYYYNADGDSYANNSDNDGYKLLYWSLNRYAANNLKGYFPNPFSTDILSGTFDLINISYYPIDIEDDVTIGAATFVFYNNNIEETETTSDTKRSTRDGLSQHYLMHMGLFKNVSASITTTGAIVMGGSVGVNNNYSGALVNGTLTGSLITAADKTITLGFYDDDELEGIPLEINDTSKYLFINKIGDKAVLELNGLYISNKEDVYDTSDDNVYASSLIGDVVGIGINLKFNNIRIDARNKEDISIKTPAQYRTTKSIFQNATLLNKYDVDSTSVAIYNFSQSEDWKNNTTRYSKVTYGKELTDTEEYVDDNDVSEENRYYENGENGNYIDPATYPGAYVSGSIANSPYDFSEDFLPYVRYYSSTVAPSEMEVKYKLHEIKVNVVPSDLKSGCGTYDHPYVIASAKQLKAVADMIDGTENSEIPNIMLPETDNGSHWCCTDTVLGENVHSCVMFTYNTSLGKYENATGTITWEVDDVRKYLVSAYYVISGNMTLDSTFKGLGAYDSEYAFKGVIVGLNDNITITNKSGVPFVKISNGSVIKRLNIIIDNKNGSSHLNVVKAGTTSTTFSYDGTYKDQLFYGGVIGKIMGGDNIIDQVAVTYNNNGYVQVPSSNSYLDCVGGYVGVIVNGGLIFRNMTSGSFKSKGIFKVNTSYSNATATGGNWVTTSGGNHLYINPYIGRVINGYAINETTTYSGDTKGYTLDNGTKNYQISDVNMSSTNKISFGTFSTNDAKDTIDIPDGQSLFMLSLITQSGAGTAQTANGDYAYAVSYDGTNPYWANVNKTTATYRIAAENVATHLAQYDKVGNVTIADKDATSSDYYLSKGDTKNSKTAVPYIISKYTQGTTANSVTTYKARTITYPGNIFIMRLTTENGTYNLPDSFRGIGSICTMKGGYLGISSAPISVRATGLDGDEDGKYALQLYGFEGNGSTININLVYNTYGYTNDNYINTVYGANASATNNDATNAQNSSYSGVHVGFGLFNYVRQERENSDSEYNTKTGYYIGNFDLSGKITVNEYDKDYKLMNGESANSNGVNRLRRRYSVGGVIGVTTIEDYVNFYKLNMKDLEVSGTSMVGGYIGRCNITGKDPSGGNGKIQVYANCCDTENLTVSSRGGYCAGMVAGLAMGFLDLYVNTAPNSGDLAGDDGYSKSNMSVSVSNKTNCTESGTGGVLGGCRTGLNQIWINNVSLSGVENKAYIKDDSTVTGDAGNSDGVGGLIGYIRKSGTIIITNSTVKNVNVTGITVGGIFGYIEKQSLNNWGDSATVRLYNTKITNTTNSEHIIEGKKYAGGISGSFVTTKGSSPQTGYDGTSKFIYDIDGCEVNNYIISQNDNADTAYGVGGLIGYADNTTRTIVNSSVHDCIIRVEGTNSKHVMGGVVGYTSNAISGYNISSYNNIFTYYDLTADNVADVCGNFIGKTNNKKIMIAGFSRQNNKLKDEEGVSGTLITLDAGNGNYGSGYIIDADYMGVNSKSSHGSAMSTIVASGVTNVGEGAGKNYFPYVTVSPKIGVGDSTILTGDGINIVHTSETNQDTGITTTTEELLATYITSERTTVAENRIPYEKVSQTDINKVKTMISNGKDTTSDHDVKLTTYKREMGTPAGYEGEDFPIIAIGGELSATTNGYNEYINAYIRVLTNTTDSFVENASNKYTIDIYPCRCINGVYQRVEGTCGLEISTRSNTKAYRMNDSNADSVQPNNQISMIDIRFLDPTDSNKTAYHLYVPVLTKKMLKFDFSSSALQGTEYEPNGYEAKFPEAGEISKLAASFNSWQTVFVRFDYSKTEIDEFLKSGKGLNWNTSKTLYYHYTGNKSLANSTQFVLLDNNNNVDKEYYIEKSGISTGTDEYGNKYDIIDFSRFKTKRNGDQTLPNEQPFEPQLLKDIAADKIKYTPDNNGAYVECSKTDATVIVKEGLTEKYFKAGTGGTKYKLELKDETLSETYYLSMYSFAKDNTQTLTTHDAYSFTVECPLTFSSNVITCQRNSAKNTQVFLGDFLKQTLYIEKTNHTPVITTTNNTVYATLRSTIEFDGLSKFYFYQNLAGEKLYQGYLVYLKRYNEAGNPDSDSAIYGHPYYEYTRTVDGEDRGTFTSGLDEGEAYLYIDPIEIQIADYVPGTEWSSVQTVDFVMDFGTDEVNLSNEFPARTKTTLDNRGIEIEAKAKLDFAQDRVLYSNKVVDGTYSNPNVDSVRYYIDRTNNNGILTITALEQPENDEYDKYGKQSHNKSALGVNGKYLFTGDKYNPNTNTEHIEAGYDYDVSNLPEEMFDGTHNLVVTIELYQKVNDNSSEGYKYVPVKFDDYNGSKGYLENFEFIGKEGEDPITLTRVIDSEGEYWSYKFTTPCTDQGDIRLLQKHFIGNIKFDVRTSDALEEIPGYLYSNYRLKVTTSVSDSSFSSEDWLVYTNAKMNAEYVKSSTP